MFISDEHADADADEMQIRATATNLGAILRNEKIFFSIFCMRIKDIALNFSFFSLLAIVIPIPV